MEEREARELNGFLGLLVFIILVVGAVFFFPTSPFWSVVLAVAALLVVSGFFIVQPNEAKVLIFFGRYLGTAKKAGFWWTIPFTTRKRLSLRVRNFNSAKLKVNDVDGNPIEIAAVVVFRVVNSAKAVFDVDKYEEFVEIQSETALRHIASQYPYDVYREEGCSLRGNSEEVAGQLKQELQERLAVAGVEVMEARLTHLAYATEIAGAMLQRQQAAAILAARQKIVEGAVGMVREAVSQLQEGGLVELDEERKATMVNNLMVAIVSERAAQPVINTGTLS